MRYVEKKDFSRG